MRHEISLKASLNSNEILLLIKHKIMVFSMVYASAPDMTLVSLSLDQFNFTIFRNRYG